MRNNKGYQLDVHKGWHVHKSVISWAGGENKTPEQILADVNKKFDERVKECIKSYNKIASKTTLTGEDLQKYCRDWMLWEVKFDDNGNLIPLDKVLEQLEETRQRNLGHTLYGKFTCYQKRIINKDNQKFCYNSGSCGTGHRVRIPSMKRSVTTWKRFYELFPYYREHYGELNNKNGIKLKKVW